MNEKLNCSIDLRLHITIIKLIVVCVNSHVTKLPTFNLNAHQIFTL